MGSSYSRPLGGAARAVTCHNQPESILLNIMKKKGVSFWEGLRVTDFSPVSRGPWKSWRRSTEGHLRISRVPSSSVCPLLLTRLPSLLWLVVLPAHWPVISQGCRASLLCCLLLPMSYSLGACPVPVGFIPWDSSSGY